jgi:VanZ family protein
MKNIKRITILYLLLIILIIALADQNEYAATLKILVEQIPYGDKWGHFILMGLLSFFINLLLNASSWQIYQFSILKGNTLVLTGVTLEEFSQQFIATRSFDLIDLLFDFLGILAFGYLAKWYLARIPSFPSKIE